MHDQTYNTRTQIGDEQDERRRKNTLAQLYFASINILTVHILQHIYILNMSLSSKLVNRKMPKVSETYRHTCYQTGRKLFKNTFQRHYKKHDPCVCNRRSVDRMVDLVQEFPKIYQINMVQSYRLSKLTPQSKVFKIFPPFMEHEGSVKCLQVPRAGHFPKPTESN